MNANTLLILLSLITANIPLLLKNQLFILLPVKQKTVLMLIAEWFFYYCSLGVVVAIMERRQSGDNHPVSWELIVITLFLFIVFTFPSIIYRYAYNR